MADAKKSRTTILGIAAAAVLIASLSVGPLTDGPAAPSGKAGPAVPPKTVSITLTGWAESQAGLPVAKLRFANDHSEKAFLIATELAVLNGDSWVTNSPPPKWVTDAFNTLKIIPGEPTICDFHVPSYDGAWKVKLTVNHQEDGLRGLTQKARDEWKTRSSGRKHTSFLGDLYEIETPTLDAPPPPPIVAIHHIGRTNDASGKPAVILRFTNRSPVSASFRPRSVVRINQNGQTTNFNLSSSISAAFADDADLEPGGSKTVIVPFPDDYSTWWLQTVIHPNRDDLTGANDRTTDKLKEMKSGQQHEASTGKFYYVDSPGIHHLRK